MCLDINVLYDQLQITKKPLHFGILKRWMLEHWNDDDLIHYMQCAKNLSWENYCSVMLTLFRNKLAPDKIWNVPVLQEIESFVTHEQLDWGTEWTLLEDDFTDVIILLHKQHGVAQKYDENWVRFLADIGYIPVSRSVLYPKTEEDKKRQMLFQTLGIYGLIDNKNSYNEISLVL